MEVPASRMRQSSIHFPASCDSVWCEQGVRNAAIFENKNPSCNPTDLKNTADKIKHRVICLNNGRQMITFKCLFSSLSMCIKYLNTFKFSAIKSFLFY